MEYAIGGFVGIIMFVIVVIGLVLFALERIFNKRKR